MTFAIQSSFDRLSKCQGAFSYIFPYDDEQYEHRTTTQLTFVVSPGEKEKLPSHVCSSLFPSRKAISGMRLLKQ